MIIGIIQARMASSRLKGKTLLPFGQSTLLGFMIERIRQAKRLDKIVVATSVNVDDDVIEQACQTLGVDVFRGSHDDVLKRFYDAAKCYGATVVVRLTADDPFKTASIIDLSVKYLLNSELDYCSNTIDLSFPEGLDVEVFTFNALENAHFNAVSQRDREHVTPFIWRNENNNFSIGQIVDNVNRSKWRITLDYEQDYVVLCALEKLLPINCSYEQIVQVVLEHELLSISNPTTKRNEAYNANEHC